MIPRYPSIFSRKQQITKNQIVEDSFRQLFHPTTSSFGWNFFLNFLSKYNIYLPSLVFYLSNTGVSNENVVIQYQSLTFEKNSTSLGIWVLPGEIEWAHSHIMEKVI